MLFFLIISTAYLDNQITINASTSSYLKVRVEFSTINQIENLPITRFIMIDHAPQYRYEITEIDSVVKPDKQEQFSSNPVIIGPPLTVKNCTLYPVIIYPSYLNNRIKKYYKSIEITFTFMSARRNIALPPSLEKVFRNLVLNYQNGVIARPQGYLIITPDAFVNDVMPLAAWKEKKGWTVEVRTLSETGNLPDDIRDYIANAYATWFPPPEYVLLIGDVNQLPPYSTATPVSRTDYPYSLITGNDFLAELLIGRLPANNVNELNTLIAKIIGYETDPFLSDTAWFSRALMIAANYPIDTMTTPIPTKRWVRDKLYETGFGTVDTVYFPPISGSAEITSAVNQGVLFVNYRGGIADPDGWVRPSFHNAEVLGLSNGWKLPVVTSITCWTGNFGQSTCFGEAWVRAGSPATPKGAVAFFGASATTTSSRWNNCLDFGIYWGLLKEQIYELGPAVYRGKMELFLNFPLDTTWMSGSSFYCHTYNLLGDPSLDIWTDVPDTFIVSHDGILPVGANAFDIQVENSLSQPLVNAQVSLYKQNEVKEIAYTDSIGYADFNFSTATPDTLFVTVTKHNFKPYCGYCLIIDSSVYVGYDSHTISDPSGNNNGEVNPGETIELQITLRNYGTSVSANNVSAKLTTTDTLITVTDSLQSYGNINPGQTAAASPFVFDVSYSAENNHNMEFDLAISSSQGNWDSYLWIQINAPECVYQWDQILDGGNGILEPGETSDLIISVMNTGGLLADNISGKLTSQNPGLGIIDSIGTFGTIPVGDSATNTSDHFTVTAASGLSPGHKIDFMAILSGDNSFVDTVDFSIIIGIVDQNKPLGPDDYGYFAYDDTDVGYPERPTYNWVEIDPNFGGPGDTISLENDETKTINLPFGFRFYGAWYNNISICSNGYVALDSTWIADMYNWHIPAAGGPPLLIAPFWDDFDPTATDSSGVVCYWHDTLSHQFIIEYSKVQHIHDPTNPTPAELQTFEVVLYDPTHYPTISNDGEILFQYKDILNDDIWHNYATVGIENREHTIGLEYTYANIYPIAAAPLANNRAIKFTTDPPDTFSRMKEHKKTTLELCQTMLEVYPNPTRKIANLRFQISNDIQNSKSSITLKIYDVSGRLIKDFSRLTHNGQHAAHFVWDCTDDNDRKIPEGVYFIHLKAKNVSVVRKIIVIK